MDNLKPFVNLGPGDVIKDEMEYYGWSQKDLAEILDSSEKHLNQILSNIAPISANMARALSSVFKQSPEFWLNLDTEYRRNIESHDQFDEVAARAEIFKRMPVRDMQKKGWLPKERDRLFDAVKAFWGRSDLDFSFLEQQLEAAKYRTSEKLSSRFNAFFAQTWLRKVKLVAENSTNVPRYSKSRLAVLASEIPAYSISENGIAKFLASLQATGVIFILLPHLEKTFTDGAAYWVGKNPIIALTGRYKRNDNFWFTMAHEIGHVLKHEAMLKEPIFIDSLENQHLVDSSEEQVANDFAAEMLQHSQICDYFKGMERISRLRVENCAAKLNIHPGIIVGCLQHKQMLSFRNLNDMKADIGEALTGL
ncbi:MAG: XRE family plasmid maintenance system antidote protein, partial [uncultured bacterium]